MQLFKAFNASEPLFPKQTFPENQVNWRWCQKEQISAQWGVSFRVFLLLLEDLWVASPWLAVLTQGSNPWELPTVWVSQCVYMTLEKMELLG